MFSLVFKSHASINLNIHSYEQLIAKSEDYNHKNNITGFLIFHKGHFLQLMEGEETKIRLLYDTIRLDSCHTDCILVSTENVHSRMFHSWSLFFDDMYSSNKDIATSEKRKQFDNLYHNSNIINSFGKTKYALWIEVNKLFNLETPAYSLL